MDFKTFQRILPSSKQLTIFDNDSDAILEKLTFCDGVKGVLDDLAQQENLSKNNDEENAEGLQLYII